ncbi:MAG: selenide, water dikinase SelD [Candidatus Eisenbacteria bacterium]|nr:selenide, water dikinase SelD [Candidatus Eisenbacteria bacterium]
MNQPIYLDYNATTPIAPEVAEAMRPYLDAHFGNPSSSHRLGIQARQAVERARRAVAELLGAQPDEIVFTSGGTESNNAAIKGIATAHRTRGRHIITSAIEHPAVSEVCAFLEQEGFRITTLPVDEYGRVDPQDLRRALTPETILVTVMHANNEVGTIQPIAALADVLRGTGVPLHVDGAQAAGKIPARVETLGVDLYSIAGHKMYAPKGIGALYIRRGLKPAKFLHGADHEGDRRAGTENVLEIVGLGRAAELAGRDLDATATRMRALRDRLHELIRERIPEVHLNGHPEQRLPNTLSLSFPGVEAHAILDAMPEVAASAGAACHADRVDVSRVLEAMGVPIERAMGTIRFSVGRPTRAAEIEHAAEQVIDVVRQLRASATKATAEAGVETGSPAGAEVRLTRFTHGLGCACKIRPQLLEEILAQMPRPRDAGLLVGTETSDDAAVYRISEEVAIVSTVDFFTPIVDDPHTFGAISTANALSDIYAMGARPLFALNLVGFPVRRLPMAVLQAILRGAAEKASEAGIAIIGGHSVDDTEPKFGLAVTGIVPPGRILRNRGARRDDALILTKPIGVGILATAAKRGVASAGAIERGSQVMLRLNREAAEALEPFDVHACTDVTGFGLVGHLREMVGGSDVGAEIWNDAVPRVAEALDWAAAGVVPGGTRDNQAHVAAHVDWDARLSAAEQLLLCDAQTSGGLLIAVPASQCDALLATLAERGVPDCAQIGRFVETGAGRVRVVRQRPE